MKKLRIWIFLLILAGFFSCEQVNPIANTGSGSTNVQVSQGDPMGNNEDNNNDNENDDNN